ncbi:hypothetical protein F5I97DRAFT_1093467 [Phlebopus sp. FC_14]|nr:hypothetical protein F5I97DRAFT_1093467 [Phlebopus sp. FC_14]
MSILPYGTALVITISFHAIAIAFTLARLTYRWYTKRFWWEDAWATFSLLWDLACLVGTLIHSSATYPPSVEDRVVNWILTLAFTCVLWAARLSVLLSLFRVSNPTGYQRQIALSTTVSFAIMWIALSTQRMYLCAKNDCVMSESVAIAQLVTDAISDTVLVVAPIPFLRKVKLSKSRRILILSAFSASILISAISIPHSILLFYQTTNVTFLFAQLKSAVSLFVCNLLFLVTFVYRIRRRFGNGEDVDLDRSFANSGTLYLTTIDFPTTGTGTTGTDAGSVDHGLRDSCTFNLNALSLTPSVNAQDTEVAENASVSKVPPELEI